MVCHTCFAPLPNDAIYCPACGTACTRAATGPTQRLIPPTPVSPAPAIDDTLSPGGATAVGSPTIRQGICPRCQAPTIYTNAHHGATQLNITPMRQGQLTHFVCRSCGYLESYLLDAADRAAVETSWIPTDATILATAQMENHVRQLRSQGLVIAAVQYVRAMTDMDIEAAIAFVEAL